MAGGSRIRRVRRALGAGVALLLLASLLACGAHREAGRIAELQRVLDRQATAVLQRDAEAYLRAVDPRAGAYRDGQRRLLRNLSRLPLSRWSYEITGTEAEPAAGVSGSGAPRMTVRAELRYQLRGYDQRPMIAQESLTLVRRGESWYVAASGTDRAPQLWELGELTVLEGRRSLVLGVGRPSSELRELARAADRSVPAVSALWPHRWAERVVVQAPASLEQMAALLDAPAAAYRGIAAVTSGTQARSPAAPADRIVVNPEAYGTLDAAARQIVLTHETTHVATRTHTSEATPMWLSEGFADWAGYLRSGRSPEQVAPSLATAVHTGAAPRELPDEADFAFDRGPGALGRAYESGWLACELIARTWGADRLVAFYTAVGTDPDTERPQRVVDRALRRVLGLGLSEFTARWRSHVAEELTR